MDDTIETLMIGVRADTAGFAEDAAALRRSLEGSLGSGAERAGVLIEQGLARAVRSGKLGFDDLKRTALAALSEIAAQAVKGGLAAILGGAGGGVGGDAAPASTGGGLLTIGTQLLGAALGLPGRATGGPVAPGRAYLVGERGPELFVPTASGAIAPTPPSTGARDVRVSITVQAPPGAEPRALTRSSRQVARAVSVALAQADR